MQDEQSFYLEESSVTALSHRCYLANTILNLDTGITEGFS